MDVITSSGNQLVKHVAKLATAKGRRETGHVMLEGPNVFAAARDAGMSFVTVLVTEDDTSSMAAADAAGAPVVVVTDRVLASVADTKHPRSPIAVIVRPTPKQEGGPGNTVVLVGVSDPGNAGTMIRTAASFGWRVAATPESVDLWAPKVVRAGAGAHFATSVRERVHLEDLTSGLTTVATLPSGGAPRVAESGPFALLVGSEAHGLDQEIILASDATLTIPTVGTIESLNASVAAGIAMYMLSGDA